MQEELFLNRYEGVFPFGVSDETLILFQEKKKFKIKLQMSFMILLFIHPLASLVLFWVEASGKVKEGKCEVKCPI